MSQEPAAPEPQTKPEPPAASPEANPSAPSVEAGVRGRPGAHAPWKPSYVFLAVVTVVNLVADIASKQWIKHYFEASHVGRIAKKIVIVPNYVNLIFATNKGGAWGILQGEQESLRRPFFLVVSVAAIVFILSLYRKLTPGQRALKWGLPLVLGGALGNLVDRILYGWVIDFIDCYTKVGADEKHWPTFNVADIAICVGVGLMAIDMFTSREPGERKAAPPETSSGPGGGAATPDEAGRELHSAAGAALGAPVVEPVSPAATTSSRDA